MRLFVSHGISIIQYVMKYNDICTYSDVVAHSVFLHAHLDLAEKPNAGTIGKLEHLRLGVSLKMKVLIYLSTYQIKQLKTKPSEGRPSSESR